MSDTVTDNRADLNGIYAEQGRDYDCVVLFENYPDELKREIIRANRLLIARWEVEDAQQLQD
jgi:hypothetical protein